MENYIDKKAVIKLILKKATFVFVYIMLVIIAALAILIGLSMIKMGMILSGFFVFAGGIFCMCVVITSVFVYEKLL